MATITIDISRYHMHQRTEQGDDPAAPIYSTCHNAAVSNQCNTGASMAVQQGHRIPGGYDHEFTISRLGMFFNINIPTGSTISSATLKLRMRKYNNPVGEENWDWSLLIRKNDTLSDPGDAGACPTADFPKYLGGVWVGTKYVDNLETYYANYEFTLPATVEVDGEDEPTIVPQTYLKLGLVSSKDVLGEAPDSEISHILEWVTFAGTPQLELVYTAPTTEVRTDSATSVTGVSAAINGTLIYDGDEACDSSFEWGLTNDYGETTTPVSKVTGETFSADITGLSPGTTYHFRAKAVNSLGTFYGADRTFRSSGSIYPSISTTRVSSLVHRWTPGSFTLEMVLGGITSEFDLIIPTGKPTPTIPMVPTVPTLPSCQIDEVLTWSLEQGYYCMKISDIPPGRF